MRATLERALVHAALEDALARRRPAAGLIHHSDRGSQYTSADYRARLAQAGMTVSMSRRGNCWDNAVVESFFATLKAELPVTRFATHAAARAAVFDDIERFYHRQLQHATRAYQTPVGAERYWREQQLAV